VRQAKTHLTLIRAAFGHMQLSEVRPSHVNAWTAQLNAKGYEQSYIYATYRRLAQVMGDAVADGIIARSPCSRKTAPKTGEQRPYVATTAQIWALYDAFPEGLRPAVLLGAFAGLRLAEVAALRVSDVDFMRGVIHPAIQYPSKPLKSETSRTAIPIPGDLALMLSAEVARTGAEVLVTNEIMRPATPWAIERAMRKARGSVEGLPDGFRFHDTRHYFASLLISAGLDVKVVQARLRHASAKTTLDTYGHLWPDRDESSRAAVAVALAARENNLRTEEVVT
jgi:integrase